MKEFVTLFILLAWSNRGSCMFKSMTSQLLPFDTTQLNYGVAVTNVGDGDGPMEWVVAGFNGPNLVLQLDPASGTYRNIAQPGTPYEALMDPQGAAIGVCACDVDGDGLEEIYFLNTNDRYSGPKTVKDKLFKWRNGAYVDLFSDEPNGNVSAMFAGRSVACVDRKGSGKYGILVATYAESYGSSKKGKFGLVEMNDADPRNDVSTGNIILHDVAVDVGIDFSTGGRGITVGPVLGDDGFSDIYFVNEGNYNLGNRGDNSFFKNDGAGSFSNVASELGLDDNQPGRGVTMADFNNDGLIDIAYGNWMGPHRLMLQKTGADGKPKFEDVAYGQYKVPTPIRTVIAADFDNNGVLEIFQNNIVYRYSGVSASNKLFSIEPSGDSVSITQLNIGDAEEPNGYGTGASVADIDNDGVLELLIAHGESKAEGLSFYHVTQAGSNNWLRILPLTVNGAPARGAKVTVTLDRQGGPKLTRIIDGGSGYLCAMEPVAHFGLGQSQAYQMSIVWPDGRRLTIDLNPTDMNKTHKITPSGLVRSSSASSQNPSASYGSEGSPTGQQLSARDSSSRGASSDRENQRWTSRARLPSSRASTELSEVASNNRDRYQSRGSNRRNRFTQVRRPYTRRTESNSRYQTSIGRRNYSERISNSSSPSAASLRNYTEAATRRPYYSYYRRRYSGTTESTTSMPTRRQYDYGRRNNASYENSRRRNIYNRIRNNYRYRYITTDNSTTIIPTPTRARQYPTYNVNSTESHPMSFRPTRNRYNRRRNFYNYNRRRYGYTVRPEISTTPTPFRSLENERENERTSFSTTGRRTYLPSQYRQGYYYRTRNGTDDERANSTYSRRGQYYRNERRESSIESEPEVFPTVPATITVRPTIQIYYDNSRRRFKPQTSSARRTSFRRQQTTSERLKSEAGESNAENDQSTPTSIQRRQYSNERTDSRRRNYYYNRRRYRPNYNQTSAPEVLNRSYQLSGRRHIIQPQNEGQDDSRSNSKTYSRYNKSRKIEPYSETPSAYTSNSELKIGPYTRVTVKKKPSSRQQHGLYPDLYGSNSEHERRYNNSNRQRGEHKTRASSYARAVQNNRFASNSRSRSSYSSDGKERFPLSAYHRPDTRQG